MKRREFIMLLSGAAASPLIAGAQQPPKMRRIGVLLGYSEDDPIGQTTIAPFRQELEHLGWSEGHNLRVDYRWGGGKTDNYRRYAAELVSLSPAVIVGSGATVRPLQEATRTIPIVFAGVNDPVGGGYVTSLARPGGNITGFGGLDYAVSVKWLELLKQLAPGSTRVVVIRDPTVPGGIGQFGALQGSAPLFGVEVIPVDVRDSEEIERTLATVGAARTAGLIVTANTLAVIRRQMIISLAKQHHLPAVYPTRIFVTDGGLISYSAVVSDNFRRAADYSTASSKAKSRPNCPCNLRRNTSWRSILKPRRRSELRFRSPVRARADEVIE